MARRTLYTVLEETTSRCGAGVAMYQPTGGKSGSGRFRTYSWLDYRQTVQEVACGLRALGVAKGDIVALHAEPSASFYMVDLGIISNGSISAALYTSLPPTDHIRTLAIVDPKALVVEDPKTLRALRNVGIQSPVWILLARRGRRSNDLRAALRSRSSRHGCGPGAIRSHHQRSDA